MEHAAYNTNNILFIFKDPNLTTKIENWFSDGNINALDAPTSGEVRFYLYFTY